MHLVYTDTYCPILFRKLIFLPIFFNIWVISPIIHKRLYLTLFDSATTSWVFTIA